MMPLLLVLMGLLEALQVWPSSTVPMPAGSWTSAASELWKEEQREERMPDASLGTPSAQGTAPVLSLGELAVSRSHPPSPPGVFGALLLSFSAQWRGKLDRLPYS